MISLTVKDRQYYFKVVNSNKLWTTFDEYKTQIRSVHYVELVSKEWPMSKFSCVHWTKNYKCHHVIRVAIFNGRTVYLDLHKTITINFLGFFYIVKVIKKKDSLK